MIRRRALADITNISIPKQPLKRVSRSKKVAKTEKIPISNESKNPFYFSRLGNPKDPQDVYDYDYEIFRNLLIEETKYLPNKNLFQNISISPENRTILIDWIQLIHAKLEMRHETIFLVTSLIDRVLSVVNVPLEDFQLMGSAAIYACVKIEEVSILPGENLVTFAGSSFSHDELRKMERLVLNSVDFKVNVPTAMVFLDRYIAFFDYIDKIKSQNIKKLKTENAKTGNSKADSLLPSSLNRFFDNKQDDDYEDDGEREQKKRRKRKIFYFAHYLNELALLFSSMIGLKPSLVAAAVIYITRLIFLGEEEEKAWPQEISEYTGMTDEEVQATARVLYSDIYESEFVENAFVRKKYGGVETECISSTTIPDGLL
ncbi:hypothetical protein TRFO_05355 [Tritrichomonas foetus]|uniref:Cyclin, N-terminal domain containing protein n=1 Tax=Tritrichomonas foetus TaxID=1144522 RepID=A0A1J4KBQ8_9EUKA|nr:hypothetical protein TRFO_05355 [Tritrichomonas foetus]|eukprot:OHT07118.1 hypothetical protein TRFO_05355 [Tritrichomonas foetus]